MTSEVQPERLQRLLNLLAQAILGNLDVRVDTEALPADDAFLELEVAFNYLLDELKLSRERNREQQAAIEAGAQQLLAKQQELVNALSTPIIVVARGVLALPIIGAVEADRALTMSEAMLDRVVRERATHVILDLTGAGTIAAGTAQSLLRMAAAVRLLGARCILTGISAEMAQTMVGLGFDDAGVSTLPQLADALAVVLGRQGQLAATSPGGLSRSTQTSDPRGRS